MDYCEQNVFNPFSVWALQFTPIVIITKKTTRYTLILFQFSLNNDLNNCFRSHVF